ncbi:hypothetical protein [Listeria monocytogenes]|uniref:Uncharacterized protein n=1 Tax=Listeria monocytogenes TaxID=1639 RepID=A0A6C8MZF4_LISMN|nr:hypothetical protein [Listeria monocytogenes]KAA9534099.1 hypothetical protein DCK33_08130 [Listeria monocytogenes]KAA9541476.1 hypothetical protein DCK32_10335 [Listeria monocytogenes]
MLLKIYKVTLQVRGETTKNRLIEYDDIEAASASEAFDQAKRLAQSGGYKNIRRFKEKRLAYITSKVQPERKKWYGRN